jgi:sigma-B regulation protein RsbU (phosphoserine phosphatase)
MPAFPGYTFGARMVPAQTVGGDFYDFIPLDSDRLGLVVGDVSGMGVPASLFMALTCSFLRERALRDVSPSTTLQRLNRFLLERNETGLFVTVVYGILDRRTGVFEYTRAGHELPLVIAPDGAIHVPPLDLGNPLGLFEEPRLDEQRILLPPGGLLLLYSDGVVEAMNEGRTLFGMERFRDAVWASWAETPQAICDDVLQTLETFRGPNVQPDDVTLVAVRALSATSR